MASALDGLPARTASTGRHRPALPDREEIKLKGGQPNHLRRACAPRQFRRWRGRTPLGMQDGSDDPSSVSMMVDRGPTCVGLEHLLDKGFIVWKGPKRLNQARHAESRNAEANELSMPAGPNMPLSAGAGSR